MPPIAWQVAEQMCNHADPTSVLKQMIPPTETQTVGAHRLSRQLDRSHAMDSVSRCTWGPNIISVGRFMANNSLFINIATVLWATNISARKRRREPDLPRHLRSHLLANLQSNIEGKAKQVADLSCIALQSIPHVLFLSCSLPLTRWRALPEWTTRGCHRQTTRRQLTTAALVSFSCLNHGCDRKNIRRGS